MPKSNVNQKTVTTTVVTKPPTPKKQKRKSKKQSKLTREIVIVPKQVRNKVKRPSRNLPREVRSICLSALLPYEGPLIRVRPGVSTSVSTPSAVARHFEYHDINFASIFTGSGPIVMPTLTNGRPVWGDLTTGIPIVSILDPYLNMIVPQRFANGSGDITTRICYESIQFMNTNQVAEGDFIFHASTNYQGPNFGDPQYASRIYISRDAPYWLDTVEWRPLQGPSGYVDGSYGQVMPCFDAMASGVLGRYTWLDAINLTDILTSDEERGFVQIQFVLPLGWTIASGEGSSTLAFVAERLADGSETNSEQQQSFFLIENGPNLVTANLRVSVSGYYKFGICGYVSRSDGQPSPNPFLPTNLILRYFPDKTLNIWTRHLVNSNVFTTNSTALTGQFFNQVKVHSGSLLIRNTTPQVALGGNVFALASTTSSAWYRLVSDHDNIKNANCVTGTHNPLITYTGPLSKGCYGWLRNTSTDFRPFTEVTMYQNGGSVACIRSYSISRYLTSEKLQQSAMNLYLVVPPNPVLTESSTIPNLTTTCLSCVQFEYTTSNQTPVVSATAFDHKAYEEAMVILQDTPTFTENPMHIDSFLSAVRNFGARVSGVYSFMRPYLKPMYSALSAFGPIAGTIGKVVDAVDDILH